MLVKDEAVGLEVAIHCRNHVRWQDHVVDADERWTLYELNQAEERIGNALPYMQNWKAWKFLPAMERFHLFFQTSSLNRFLYCLSLVSDSLHLNSPYRITRSRFRMRAATDSVCGKSPARQPNWRYSELV